MSKPREIIVIEKLSKDELWFLGTALSITGNYHCVKFFSGQWWEGRTDKATTIYSTPSDNINILSINNSSL